MCCCSPSLKKPPFSGLSAYRFDGTENTTPHTQEDGAKIEQIDRRAFNLALDTAGIEDFTFHDLRHTWASWHVQTGTPLFVLKELAGWETIEMVKKYVHLNAGRLAEHVNVVTFWSQHQAEKQRAAG